jgi:radical SAM-linked protein
MAEVSVMKVRVKFTKTGVMKFIGHLDTMRYFQKAIRRAGIDIAYSSGFSPHMIMSFAAPLGVGVTSDGEYFDMELRTAQASAVMEKRLNDTMVEGMQILSIRKIPDEKSSNAMSLVSAADYLVTFRPGKELPDGWKERMADYLAQKQILCMKPGKKGEREVDIRPWIYQMEVRENGIFMQLSSGSVRNLKPEMVIKSFAAYLGTELDEFALMIHRQEVYADLGSESKRKLVSLENLGEEIE